MLIFTKISTSVQEYDKTVQYGLLLLGLIKNQTSPPTTHTKSNIKSLAFNLNYKGLLLVSFTYFSTVLTLEITSYLHIWQDYLYSFFVHATEGNIHIQHIILAFRDVTLQTIQMSVMFSSWRKDSYFKQNSPGGKESNTRISHERYWELVLRSENKLTNFTYSTEEFLASYKSPFFVLTWKVVPVPHTLQDVSETHLTFQIYLISEGIP